MAAGVSWLDRSPTDWLASNGRWYPASHYPRGWHRTALPPAPGQGGMGSILRRYAESALEGGRNAPAGSSSEFYDADFEFGDYEYVDSNEDASGDREFWSTPSAAAQRAAAPQPRAPGFSVSSPGRRPANATVTSQRDYAAPVDAGRTPPKKLTSGAPAPSNAPGRIHEEGDSQPPPSPPTSKSHAPVKRPLARAEKASEFEVIAGDLGKVLGGAKRRIEQAINEAAKQ